MRYKVDKTAVISLLDNLSQEYDIIAPVKDNNLIKFRKINNTDEVVQDYINSKYSIKKYFLPNKEILFEYTKESIQENLDTKKRIFFGIRPCDVHSLLVMDKLLLGDEMEDIYYKTKRQNSLIFSIKCNESGENCFCQSLGTDKLEKGYDLMFYDQGDYYIVETGSEKGTELINKIDNKQETDKLPEDNLENQKKLPEEQINKLRQNFEDNIWEDESKICFSCAGCTTTCPTCGCFDVEDDPNLDFESGKRIRLDASCQLKNYTGVAGGHVFREERSKRFKHRIYHKFQYYKDQYGRYMCIGCGRCITNCPAKIDMVKILNKL
jgi:formate hydrogenlyase subunit 6/NADH:ubiquinone oxidoreductase subunit I